MTACFKLMRVLQSPTHPTPDTVCPACVYFSENLDEAEYPVQPGAAERCGLGFLPGDDGCVEMGTDNCSARKG